MLLGDAQRWSSDGRVYLQTDSMNAEIILLGIHENILSTLFNI